MAHLPAETAGGLELLIERLESGTAGKGDQRWAAKLLKVAKPSQRVAGAGVKVMRDWGIFYDVARLIEGGMGEKAAYEKVAEKLLTAYRFEHTGKRPRPMDWRTVQTIYLERKRTHEELEAWAEAHPDLAYPDRFED